MKIDKERIEREVGFKLEELDPEAVKQRAKRGMERHREREEERKRYEAIGATPWIWSKWGSILNSDLCDVEADLESMDHKLDPWFAMKLIAKGSRAWAIVGLVLKRVFRYRLWEKMGHDSLKDFCREVLGRSVGYCKQTIRAAEVALELAAANFDLIPSCQSQATALAKYLGDPRNGEEYCPELLREKWQEILSAAEATRSQITAGFIQATLNPDKPIKSDRRVQFDPKTWDLVERGAAAAGMDPEQWLKRLIRQQDEEANAIETPSPQAEEEWQQDLSELVEEEAPQVQQVVHNDGSVAELPTLFDVNRYNAPAPPAQIVEDGPQDFWEPSPVEQNPEQLTIYDALDGVRSPGLAQNTQGDTGQPSPGRMENNEGDTRQPSPGRMEMGKAKRKRSRRTIGEILGWSGTGAYRPAAT